ncbi:serine/threonine-protein kinase [Streptomyces sp. TLI_171]|uniref:serine/threonine-protein kinase n=1 Tax=Streptomyces sp. TLI_171 TaxID=1938859 RepID=UPI0015D53C27|nr:serine/threonine-protein kinase [Streptomyces sp. TLI_171]
MSGSLVAGRYRLEERLGRGGMGEVWRAHDQQLGRRVAIKFLFPEPDADGSAAARFHREASITAQLQHDGITQVHDHGEQDGRHFLIMELLAGRNLGALLRDQPSGLPVRKAVDVLAQAAAALGYAHSRGIVHRDVKPANLMLLPGGRVKVCDFGIAGFVRGDSGLTRAGSVLGTPDYMAPEQWRAERADGRTDLYALGCVLFALLTGRTPFPRRPDFWAAMHDHVATPPPRLAALRPGVPAVLDRLAAQLLAKHPDDRPAHAGVVADRLRALNGDGRPATLPDGVFVRPGPGDPPTPADPGIVLTSAQNEYLPPGGQELSTMVTVTAGSTDPHDLAAAAPRALVFLLGLSTALPVADLRAVTRTVADTIDGLDEGDRFAVVTGSEYASMCYPDSLRTVRATPATKAEARAALDRLEPVRAAAFGRWIRMADRLFAGHADAVRTAIMLMDLRSEAELPGELAAALAASTGRFSCHVRGVGTGWEVAQARAVGEALRGTVDIVHADSAPGLAAALAADLDAVVERTRQAFARDLALRITTPPGGGVRFLKLVSPQVEDLTGHGLPTGPGVTEFRVDVPDGRSHEYHLSLEVPPGPVGERITAADLAVILLPPAGDGQELARLMIPAERTDDRDSLTIDHRVAHYTGQAELAEAIMEGLRARADEPSEDQARASRDSSPSADSSA